MSECNLCGKELKKTRYYIDYHISKNTHSWETISGLVENGEITVCKKCAIRYRNIMVKMFKQIGFKNWLKTIPYNPNTNKWCAYNPENCNQKCRFWLRCHRIDRE